MGNNIIINKAIVHTLDMNIGEPLLSNKLLQIDDSLYQYINKQINKIESISTNKKYQLKNTSENCEILLNIKTVDFIEATHKLSDNIYNIMRQCYDTKSSNLLYCIYENKGTQKFAMLKLNYKDSYINKLDTTDGVNYNKLIKYRATLPNILQKPDESFVFNINTNQLFINEQKYILDDERCLVFSNYIFKQELILSPNEIYKIIDKTSRNIINQYFNNDITTKIAVQNEIVDSFNSTGYINLDDIIKNVFNSDIEIKKVLKKELEGKGIYDNIIKLDYSLDKKINKKYKIKTQEGIEILIPVDYLTDDNVISIGDKDDCTVNINMNVHII